MVAPTARQSTTRCPRSQQGTDTRVVTTRLSSPVMSSLVSVDTPCELDLGGLVVTRGEV